MLTNNTDLPPEEAAVRYKGTLQGGEDLSRSQGYLVHPACPTTIRFLHPGACLRFFSVLPSQARAQEKDRGPFEWEHMKQDLGALQEAEMEQEEKTRFIRIPLGCCAGKIFKAVSAAPSTKEADPYATALFRG